MKAKRDHFINLLKDFSSPGVFNPWNDVDAENDISGESPLIRTGHLHAYLTERTGKAKYILMGEAIGYQGGHFSGIAMTSERILLGHMKGKGIGAEDVFTSISPRRTSRESVRPNGFTEPTASIVWGSLLNMGVAPADFVIWNTFAWHPYNPAKGMLSNRKPTDDELASGIPVLKAFLSVFPEAKVIAVGKVAEKELESLAIDCLEVRHPANGGAGKFRQQIGKIVSGK
ncbi:MAG: uracil-DNA glycosylase [Deltaproteobacteria bacterium]|nr:uracil-DNA glycosylase [Deltaproteobacteria bacterium]